MSISKVIIVCVALAGAHTACAQTVLDSAQRPTVSTTTSVPPDPYVVAGGGVLHNPPMFKDVDGRAVPPDPYKTIGIDVTHNPPDDKIIKKP